MLGCYMSPIGDVYNKKVFPFDIILDNVVM
jgi:hypothetical protein